MKKFLLSMAMMALAPMIHGSKPAAKPSSTQISAAEDEAFTHGDEARNVADNHDVDNLHPKNDVYHPEDGLNASYDGYVAKDDLKAAEEQVEKHPKQDGEAMWDHPSADAYGAATIRDNDHVLAALAKDEGRDHENVEDKAKEEADALGHKAYGEKAPLEAKAEEARDEHQDHLKKEDHTRIGHHERERYADGDVGASNPDDGKKDHDVKASDGKALAKGKKARDGHSLTSEYSHIKSKKKEASRLENEAKNSKSKIEKKALEVNGKVEKEEFKVKEEVDKEASKLKDKVRREVDKVKKFSSRVKKKVKEYDHLGRKLTNIDGKTHKHGYDNRHDQNSGPSHDSYQQPQPNPHGEHGQGQGYSPVPYPVAPQGNEPQKGNFS